MSETFLYIFSNLGLFLLKMLVQFGSFPLKNYPPPYWGAKKCCSFLQRIIRLFRFFFVLSQQKT